jgi:hypothetical protein
MDTNVGKKAGKPLKMSYAEKVKQGGESSSRDFQHEMQRCTAIVCIDASYAKVALGVTQLAEKLHIHVVALVAGGKGRWKVVTEGEKERDLLLKEKSVMIDGREANIIGHKPLNMLYVEAEFPIVSAEEVKLCFEKNAKEKVVRMEKLYHSKLWTGIWLVWTTFEPTQRISKWQGRGFLLKVEDRTVSKPMRATVPPVVVRDDVPARENEDDVKSSPNEQETAVEERNPDIIEEPEKEREDEIKISENAEEDPLGAFHSPVESDEEEQLKESKEETEESHANVEEPDKYEKVPPQTKSKPKVNQDAEDGQRKKAETRKAIEQLKSEITKVSNQMEVTETPPQNSETVTGKQPKMVKATPRVKVTLMEDETEKKVRKGQKSHKKN